MQRESLGLIETQGYTAAVEAVDTACKTSRVVFIGYHFVGMGLVTVKFSGDVAAVKAAVTAGSAAARKVGRVVSVHVIPRPHGQLAANGTASPDTAWKEYAPARTKDLSTASDRPVPTIVSGPNAIAESVMEQDGPAEHTNTGSTRSKTPKVPETRGPKSFKSAKGRKKPEK